VVTVRAYHLTVEPSLRSTLRERGLRMTPQRQLVLDAVRDLGHSTPEQICARVQESAPVNITTIYRTLDLLERLGLVRHTHLGHGAPTYSEQEHQHVHLVCHDCGEVSEVPAELLDGLAQEAERRFGGLGPFSAAEVTSLVSAAFLGSETMILLEIESPHVPVRQALRRFGETIRRMEEAAPAT